MCSVSIHCISDHVSHVTYQLLSSSTSCKRQQRASTKSINNGESSSVDVITVSSTGLMTSHSSTGTVNVLVTVHEEFGFNQTAIIEVEVKLIWPNLHLFFVFFSFVQLFVSMTSKWKGKQRTYSNKNKQFITKTVLVS